LVHPAFHVYLSLYLSQQFRRKRRERTRQRESRAMQCVQPWSPPVGFSRPFYPGATLRLVRTNARVGLRGWGVKPTRRTLRLKPYSVCTVRLHCSLPARHACRNSYQQVVVREQVFPLVFQQPTV
jgi:hypothetical protein